MHLKNIYHDLTYGEFSLFLFIYLEISFFLLFIITRINKSVQCRSFNTIGTEI